MKAEGNSLQYGIFYIYPALWRTGSPIGSNVSGKVVRCA
jgi:hypothetical protein